MMFHCKKEQRPGSSQPLYIIIIKSPITGSTEIAARTISNSMHLQQVEGSVGPHPVQRPGHVPGQSHQMTLPCLEVLVGQPLYWLWKVLLKPNNYFPQSTVYKATLF